MDRDEAVGIGPGPGRSLVEEKGEQAHSYGGLGDEDCSARACERRRHWGRQQQEDEQDHL
jgi:hypothetical protein